MHFEAIELLKLKIQKKFKSKTRYMGECSPKEGMHLPRKYERINVKGHYRTVARDSDGTFKKVKKWSSEKGR